MTLLIAALLVLGVTDPGFAELPCDRYPTHEQKRCETLWKEINNDAVAEMAEFGMKQLKLRQEGKITQEQHLQQNTDFIKQSAQKRLNLLSERMNKAK